MKVQGEAGMSEEAQASEQTQTEDVQEESGNTQLLQLRRLLHAERVSNARLEWELEMAYFQIQELREMLPDDQADAMEKQSLPTMVPSELPDRPVHPDLKPLKRYVREHGIPPLTQYMVDLAGLYPFANDVLTKTLKLELKGTTVDNVVDVTDFFNCLQSTKMLEVHEEPLKAAAVKLFGAFPVPLEVMTQWEVVCKWHMRREILSAPAKYPTWKFPDTNVLQQLSKKVSEDPEYHPFQKVAHVMIAALS